MNLQNKITSTTIKIKSVIFAVVLLIFAVYLMLSRLNSFEIGAEYHFQTQENEFSYTVVTAKGPHLETMIYDFETFKDTSGLDITLYRTFRKGWKDYSKWIDYLTDPKYQFPYLPTE